MDNTEKMIDQRVVGGSFGNKGAQQTGLPWQASWSTSLYTKPDGEAPAAQTPKFFQQQGK